MARSRYKFLYFNRYIWKHSFSQFKFNNWTKVRDYIIYSKNFNIPVFFKKHRIKVHKGHQFKKLIINSKMIGHKLGRFFLTRKPFFFPIKVKKKKK